MTTVADESLGELKPNKRIVVAIDSDGCVFDVMGIKQRECFCPMMIAYFGLQPVAEAARECKMFADLYSQTRGANRHKTIARILTELLPSHPKVKQSGFKVPDFRYYVEWANNPKSVLSDAGLKQAIEAAANEEQRKQLHTAIRWSARVNEMVAEVVRNIPPFKFVRESLEKVREVADIVVCSATPVEALKREWAEHGLLQYAAFVAGQEMGSKAQHLSLLREKYGQRNTLMVGDAPGDLAAARQNTVCFYPINPGSEETSWRKFHDEGFEKFVHGNYAGAYEGAAIQAFEDLLPVHPCWH